MGGRVIGVDLAVARPHTLAVLDGCSLTEIAEVWTDQLVDYVALCSPSLVAVDAPLSMPKEGHLREVERDARRLGLRLLPPLLGGMRALTLIGIALRRSLESVGIRVVEVHPSSTLRLAGVSIDRITRWANMSLNRDQTDGVVAALTGLAYLLNDYTVVGGELIVATRLPCV